MNKWLIIGVVLGVASAGYAQQYASALITPHEAFVPSINAAPGATIELRDEATIIGKEVKVKSVCRWNASDAKFFAPVAELTIVTMPVGKPFKGISVDQVRAAIAGAGMNLGNVRFMGPLACAITRVDTEVEKTEAFDQWAAAHQAQTVPIAAPVVIAAPIAQPAGARTLKEILTLDLAEHLSLPVESLALQFNDEKTVLLNESTFRFAVTPLKANSLGVVRWDVTISAAQSGGPSKHAILEGYARAWEEEVVAVRPIAYRKMIQDTDVVERRMLIDHLPDDPLLAREQVVGEQAARELHVGSVFNSRMVQAMPLVKVGQLVTVTMSRGAFAVTTVGKAMEEGAFGQTIHVRNDETKEVFDVTVTGQQTAKLE